MTVKNNEENTPVSASAEVAPTADAISGSVNPNPNNNSNNNSPKPLAAVDPVNVEPVLVGLGLTPSALEALSVQTTALEEVLRGFAGIPASERTRFRLQARGNVPQGNQVKDLAGQFAESVPGASGAETLQALDNARNAVRSERARLQAAVLRLEDAETQVNREFQRRVRLARASLQTDSTFGSADLRQQVERTKLRRKKKKTAGAPAAGTGNGAGTGSVSGTGGSAGSSPAAVHPAQA